MAKNDVKLVVVDAFDDYRRGDEITDSATITTILGTEQKLKVRKVAVIIVKEG